MLQTLLIILPMTLIAALGFCTVRFGLFSRAQMDALSAICFNLLIPIFLFNTTYHTELSSGLPLSWFATFYIPVVAIFLLMVVFYRSYDNASLAHASLRALSSTYSNTVLVAIPIITGVLGTKQAGLGFILIAFHSAVLFTLTDMLVNNGNLRNVIKSFKNPIVLSILFGFAANLLNIPIPDLVLQPLVKLSQSAIPLALFGLGAAIYFLPLKGNIKVASINTLVKLFVLPGTVYLIGTFVFQLEWQWLFIAVMLTAAPTGVGAYVMATKHNLATESAAGSVIISTLLSIVSAMIWLAILQ